MNENARLYTQFDYQPYHIRDFLLALARYYHLPDNCHFLDVGCGPGRLLLPMAQQGWIVSGLEPDADYLAFARETLSQSERIIDVQRGGFDTMTAHQQFDVIGAINNPFAYLLTQSARIDALQRMFSALHSGGLLVLDFYNLLWRLRHFQQPETALIPQADGTMLRRIIHYKIDWHTSSLTHTDQFYRNQTLLSTQVHRLAIVAPQTIISLIADVGFTDIRTYNSYAHIRPQRLSGKRVVISAQKPV